jgi:predicted nucleotidyltransferase
MAVDQLGELANDIVFLGGTATGLLITDKAAPPLRVTRDVDAIVEILSHTEYRQLEKQLRKQGFKEDRSKNAPICRWISSNVILDIMPTNSKILGFGNKWYAPALQHAQCLQLPSNKTIKCVTAPYFLITKLEAFKSRGNGDYLMSHDIEDIVAIFDGRATLLEEVLKSEQKLRKELSQQFTNLLKNNDFINAVSAHLPTDETSQARVIPIIKTMKQISLTGNQS